jgi:putative ABC transport system permease protein
MSPALRQLAKSPGFTAVVVLLLALGIGATTALFSVVNAVLLRPLAYREPDRIVRVSSLNQQRGSLYAVSGPDYRDWRGQSTSFVAFAKYQFSEAAVVTASAAEKLGAAMVSTDFFRALDVTPVAGRFFHAEEMVTGGVAVVGEAFSRRHYAGDPTRALGTDVKLWGRTFRIVGVVPAWCALPESAEIWLPVDTVFSESMERSAHNYRVVARLRPEVSLGAAQTEMDGIAARIAQQFPDTNTNKGVRLVPLREGLVAGHRATLWTMLGAVSLVLLIACANIANLLLARGARRTHEMAVRAALGASRARIVRQLLAESLVLASLGGAAGVLVAIWGLDVLLALAPVGIPRLDEVSIDRWALAFAGGVSLIVCLLTGLFPALQATRTDLKTALHASGRGVTGTRGRLRSALVVAQLAISLVLLTSAGLLLRSFQRLTSIDPGYRTDQVLVMEASYPAAGEVDARRALAFYDEFSRRAAALPGIGPVSSTGSLPIDVLGANGSYFIENRPSPSRAEIAKQNAIWRIVGADYFSTLGITVLAGREITARDTAQSTRTVVINESLARAAWPGEDPLGHRIKIGWDSAGEWMTIVGVVADTRQGSLDRTIKQELYVPATQHPKIATDMKVIARVRPNASVERAVDPLTFAAGFRRLAQELDPEVPVRFTTAELLVANTLATPRFRTLVLALFAGVALLIAAVGLYSVLAYAVAQRTAEIGLRMALGAQRHHVLGLILRGGATLVALGLALGLGLAAATSRLMQAFLFQVPPIDLAVYSTVAAIFAGIALIACLLPAHRAVRVDPISALRAE